MIGELIISFLADKKSALQSIFVDIESTFHSSSGMASYLGTIDDCALDEANLRKKLKTLMKVIAQQNSIIRKLLFINLVYMQGSNFDDDAAVALNKMGRGEEALRQMFKNKMGGR